MYVVWSDVVQKTLIVRDNQKSAFFAAHSVDSSGYDFQRVDIQPRVDLVKNCDTRLQHHHLKNFVALFLTAGKSFIEITMHKLRIDLQLLHLCFHLTNEFDERDLIAFSTTGIDGSSQEVSIGHPCDFTRILHRQENSCKG